MKKLSKGIRTIRLMRNLSQENIAEDLKMSQQNFSKLERGERDIKLSKLEAIAAVLGVKIDDILSFDEKIYFNIHDNHNSNNGLIIHQDKTDVAGEKEQMSREIAELKNMVEQLQSKLQNNSVS